MPTPNTSQTGIQFYAQESIPALPFPLGELPEEVANEDLPYPLFQAVDYPVDLVYPLYVEADGSRHVYGNRFDHRYSLACVEAYVLGDRIKRLEVFGDGAPLSMAADRKNRKLFYRRQNEPHQIQHGFYVGPETLEFERNLQKYIPKKSECAFILEELNEKLLKKIDEMCAAADGDLDALQAQLKTVISTIEDEPLKEDIHRYFFEKTTGFFPRFSAYQVKVQEYAAEVQGQVLTPVEQSAKIAEICAELRRTFPEFKEQKLTQLFSQTANFDGEQKSLLLRPQSVIARKLKEYAFSHPKDMFQFCRNNTQEAIAWHTARQAIDPFLRVKHFVYEADDAFDIDLSFKTKDHNIATYVAALPLPFDEALRNRAIQRKKRLLEHIYQKNKALFSEKMDGFNAMFHAIRVGDVETVEWFVAHDGVPDTEVTYVDAMVWPKEQQNPNKTLHASPFLVAAIHGHVGLLNRMLDSQSSLHAMYLNELGLLQHKINPSQAQGRMHYYRVAGYAANAGQRKTVQFLGKKYIEVLEADCLNEIEQAKIDAAKNKQKWTSEQEQAIWSKSQNKIKHFQLFGCAHFLMCLLHNNHDAEARMLVSDKTSPFYVSDEAYPDFLIRLIDQSTTSNYRLLTQKIDVFLERKLLQKAVRKTPDFLEKVLKAVSQIDDQEAGDRVLHKIEVLKKVLHCLPAEMVTNFKTEKGENIFHVLTRLSQEEYKQGEETRPLQSASLLNVFLTMTHEGDPQFFMHMLGLLQKKDGDGNTPLHAAAMCGDSAFILQLFRIRNIYTHPNFFDIQNRSHHTFFEELAKRHPKVAIEVFQKVLEMTAAQEPPIEDTPANQERIQQRDAQRNRLNAWIGQVLDGQTNLFELALEHHAFKLGNTIAQQRPALVRAQKSAAIVREGIARGGHREEPEAFQAVLQRLQGAGVAEADIQQLTTMAQNAAQPQGDGAPPPPPVLWFDTTLGQNFEAFLKRNFLHLQRFAKNTPDLAQHMTEEQHAKIEALHALIRTKTQRIDMYFDMTIELEDNSSVTPFEMLLKLGAFERAAALLQLPNGFDDLPEDVKACCMKDFVKLTKAVQDFPLIQMEPYRARAENFLKLFLNQAVYPRLDKQRVADGEAWFKDLISISFKFSFLIIPLLAIPFLYLFKKQLLSAHERPTDMMQFKVARTKMDIIHGTGDVKPKASLYLNGAGNDVRKRIEKEEAGVLTLWASKQQKTHLDDKLKKLVKIEKNGQEQYEKAVKKAERNKEKVPVKADFIAEKKAKALNKVRRKRNTPK